MKKWHLILLMLYGAIALNVWHELFTKPVLTKLFSSTKEVKAEKPMEGMVHYIDEPTPKRIHKPARSFYGEGVDTLGSNDTIYLYPHKRFHDYGYLEMRVVSDSLNGSTTGMVTIERSVLGLTWDKKPLIDPVILNGSIDQEINFSDFAMHEKFRIKIISPAVTQATKITFQSKAR